MIFGAPKDGDALALWLAGFNYGTLIVGRFRSAWVERGDDGEPRVAVYTRNGGGNSEYCTCTEWARGYVGEHDCPCMETGGPACRCTACCTNELMPAMPTWLYGADDEFDCTYRTEYFRLRDGLPEGVVAAVRESAGDQVDMSERWQSAIAALDEGKAA